MSAPTCTTKFEANPPGSRTFASQDKLPKLPIPPLEESLNRYLRALEGLQDPKDHERTKRAVEEFLHNEGPVIQEKLRQWAQDKASYIEDFWYESYLSHSDPVVLALNPFFVLE
ncbi:CoA-dependent acyltransferase [Panus rudis PR-1116 ss-1]|nr:CoA-dependent acyltransferase [Panus rudis PR-1116 ss-1]